MKKRIKIIIFAVIGLVLLLGVISFFMFEEIQLHNSKLHFYMNETHGNLAEDASKKIPLDGIVFFKNSNLEERINLGSTTSGKLKYDIRKLSSGEITFYPYNNTIQYLSLKPDAPSLSFNITEEDLSHRKIDFTFSKRELDIKNEIYQKEIEKKYAPEYWNFSITSERATQMRDEIFDLMNYERMIRGIPNLSRDKDLDRAAQNFSDRMTTEGYFYEHIDPQGKNPLERMADLDLGYENEILMLTYASRSSKEIVKIWMNSSGHRTAILWPYSNLIGIGYNCTKIINSKSPILDIPCYPVGEFGRNLTNYDEAEKLYNECMKNVNVTATITSTGAVQYTYEGNYDCDIIINNTIPNEI